MAKQEIFEIDENNFTFKVVIWDWYDIQIANFFESREIKFDSINDPLSQRWNLKGTEKIWMLLSHPDKEFIEAKVNNDWVSSKEEFFRVLKLLAFE